MRFKLVTCLAFCLLAGCETFITHEAAFKTGGMNGLPPLEVDYSKMPKGAVVLESEHSGGFGVERHEREVYRIHGPARIVIEPLK